MENKAVNPIREIKFRGMTIGGEMVIGNYTYLKKDKSSVIKKGHYISNSGGAPFAYMVRPETIGQFTGLKDKNGLEIYEGDIIERIYRYEVRFERGRFLGFHKRANMSYDEIKGDFTIIGNIHEHKHILTYGEDN